MAKHTENEMEQIQKGLELFLEHEVEEMERPEEPAEEEELDREQRSGRMDDAYGYRQEEIRSRQLEGRRELEQRDEWEGGQRNGRKRNNGGERVRRQPEWEEWPEGEEGRKEEKRMKEKKGKRKKKKSVWKRLLIILAVLAALFFGGLYLIVGAVYNKMTYEEQEGLADGPLKSDGVISVLLIGSDSRDSSSGGRSDAMILLTISDRTKTVHMTSLLRDMYVEIPGHDGNRLNAAYAYGGAELLLETINQNLGTSVNRYAVVNFEAFANLVDAVGGVDMELTNEEVGWVNAYLNEYNELRGMPLETDYLDTSLSGNIHLNGAQALAYCRNRYIGTDFGRTQRQRKVLTAVLQKLPLAAVTNPAEIVNGLFGNLTTNLTQVECTQLALSAGKLLTYEMVQDSLPLEGTYSNATIREMSVLQVDFEQNKAYIRKEIYGEE